MVLFNFKTLLVLINLILQLSMRIRGDSSQKNNFVVELKNLEKETKSLCSIIGNDALSQADQFLKHLNIAYIKCPDRGVMENKLANLLVQGKAHKSALIDQMNDCFKLSDMLTKGLENINMVLFYINEGNYKFVEDILDRWHQSFTDFDFQLFPSFTHLEIISEFSMVFYYDNWSRGIFVFLFTWLIIVICLIYYISRFRSLSLLNSIPNNTERTKETHQINRYFKSDRVEPERNITLRNVFCVVAFPILVGFGTAHWFGQNLFDFPKPIHVNWHPEASQAIVRMIEYKDNVKSILKENILLIEDLKNHMSVYKSGEVKESVAELLSLFRSKDRDSKIDIEKLYTNYKQIKSSFDGIIQHIETKVDKKDETFTATLSVLNQISESQKEMYKYIKVMVLSHMHVVPLMKQSLKAIQASIHNGLYIETLPLVEKNQEILLDLGENNQKVKAKLKFVLSLSGSEGFNALGYTLQDIKTAIQRKENRGYFQSVLSTAGIFGTGAVAIKSIPLTLAFEGATVLAMVSLPVTAMAMASGYFLYQGLNEINMAKDIRKDIEILETMRANFIKGLEQFSNATEIQERSLDDAKNTLNKISRICDQHSRIKGYILNGPQLADFDCEINSIVNNYDRIKSYLKLFFEDLTKHDRQLN